MASDAMAVIIVTPADGPSLGMAPAGMWTWISLPASSAGWMPTSAPCERVHERAIRADSRMTSPSWPVRTRRSPGPSACVALASTNRTSPPAPVTARPVATPGVAVRSAASWWNFGRPRASCRSSGPMVMWPSAPSATRRAALRSTLPISRSSPRTPASRV